MAKQQLIPIKVLNELNTPGAGYDILRYIGLHDLLGEESPTILYYMGKNLARKFEITSLEDLYYFFDKMGWGKLEFVKQKKKEFIFTLLSDSVVHRLNAPLETEFRLEAGFLAEAIQLIKEVECECVEEVNRKIHQIEFKVVFTA